MGTSETANQALRAQFEGIFKYFDSSERKTLAKILPGEYYITDSTEELIVTTLGSCVSACIRDPLTGLGGMNHFMVPETSRQVEHTDAPNSPANCYGVFAMESLINGLLRQGCRRNRLEIKVTGGGQIGSGSSSVGRSNVDFIRRFLRTEGLPALVEDLGGFQPRRVSYDPISGRLRVKKIVRLADQNISEQEDRYRRTMSAPPAAGTVDLF